VQTPKEVLIDPIFNNNPIALQVLGVCSALAVTVNMSTTLVMCAAVIAVPAGIDASRFDRFLTRKDTRTLAKEWVENNIASGTRIAVEFYPPQVYNSNEAFSIIGPKTPQGKSVNSGADGRTEVKEYELFDTQYLEFFWGPDRLITEDPVQIIKTKDIEYVIIDSWTSARFYQEDVMDEYPLLSGQRRDFYDWVKQNCQLLTDFASNERPGPVLSIYKVKDDLLVKPRGLNAK